ncbi:hypothetical protein N9Y89_02395 [bacterium]|nr:hypothetical protein [bacterium]
MPENTLLGVNVYPNPFKEFTTDEMLSSLKEKKVDLESYFQKLTS